MAGIQCSWKIWRLGDLPYNHQIEICQFLQTIHLGLLKKPMLEL